jgi:hypothetical protein
VVFCGLLNFLLCSGGLEPAFRVLFFLGKITEFFKSRRIELNLKYIDPSYTIRSVPASAQDNVYCLRLAQYAVHAAMAGKTNMLIGQWHRTFVYIPFGLVTNGRRRLDPAGDLWQAVLECTGQPARLLWAIVLRSLTGAVHLLTLANGREALLVWLGVLVSFWDQSLDSLENGRQLFRQDKTQEESALPQGRGDSLVAQLDSAVNQAEQFRDQQIQQQYSDQLGVYVQEKAQQIDRLQSAGAEMRWEK